MAEPEERREQLEVHLLATARAVRRAYDIRLAELDLHMTESGLLQILDIEGSLSQTALAGRLHVGRSAAGGFIEGLTARGLVERHRDPDDGRIWRINNTTAGTALAQTCAAMNQEIRRDLRAGLTRAEQHQLHTLLSRVRSNADHMNDEAQARV